MKTTILTKNQGSGLLEVVIASAILIILMLGVMEIISTQRKETTALTEKLATLEFQRELSNATIFTQEICDYIITNTTFKGRTSSAPSPTFKDDLTFDSTADLKKLIIEIDHIPRVITKTGIMNPDPTLQTYSESNITIATLNQIVSPISPSAKVKKITLANFTAINPTAFTYSAEIQVHYDETKLVHSIKPGIVTVQLQTDNAGGGIIRKIKTCGAGSTIIGTVDWVMEEGGSKVGCRFAWGDAYCDSGGDVKCYSGATLKTIHIANDLLNETSDGSAFQPHLKNLDNINYQITLFACIK